MHKTSLKLLLYASATIVVLVMLRLGSWQLSRAEEKQSIQNYVVAQQAQQIDLGQHLVTMENLYQQGQGLGEYLIEESILVDNQVVDGRVGYHVLVPFRLLSNQQIILVNAGWVSAGASREIKPTIVMPKGQIQIAGRLQKPHSKPPIWQDDTLLVQDGAWQYLSLVEFTERTNLNIAPLILELHPLPEAASQYIRQWRSYDDTWINRHKAYALQWFSMAAVFILMCLVLEFRSRRK